MKRFLFSACAIFLMFNTGLISGIPMQQDSLKVLCSKDMFDLANDWAGGFNTTSHESRVSVNVLKKNGSISGSSIAIVEGKSPLLAGNGWRMIVGRDVIVPVISVDNPLIGKIRSKGISPENLASYIMNPGSRTWGKLLGTDNRNAAVFCLVNDQSLKESLTDFLETDLTAGKLYADARELFTALEKDHSALGFCKMINLTDNSNEAYTGKIALAPIDRNSDGIIDHNEDIYENLTAFSRGVWIGKYPRALTSAIYVAVNGKIEPAQAAFLTWIISDGQDYLDKSGYTQLLAGEAQTGQDKLAEITASPVIPATRSVFITLLYVVIALVALAGIFEIIARLGRKNAVVPDTSQKKHLVLDENIVILPGGILFDKSHTWAFMEKDGIVKIGVDDFLHRVTGEITKLNFRHEGDSVLKGDEILSVIRNGKHLTLYSPVSGTIIQKNIKLESDTRLLSDSPYEEGWIYRIQPVSWAAENYLLLMADKYREFIRSEIVKLKEFLAGFLNNEHPAYSTVVLQDGGSLIDSPLEAMGPEVWEEFQIKFIDSAKTH